MHPPELLSPAGDFDALRAAVANGADAVYFGLDQFNARHRAANFTLVQLPEVMAYLHAHNTKGFLTFNTLIFSDELPQAQEYLTAIASAGVDAVIVQDLGITRLLQRLAPSLPVHGSTQMTLTEPAGIEFVRQLGVKRVVLARELSLLDIDAISHATDMPLEVFVHGALCVAYSGQCLTSESLGGRSANRGQCAQACRLPYELIVDGNVHDLQGRAYLLSPSDLAAHDLIADLTRLGVASFKIEGRLKSPHYVAATTQTYRAAIDAASSNLKFQISDQQKHDLEQTFSRGFTPGFLNGVNHQTLVAARSPKSRGTKIGAVLSATPRAVVIQLETRNPTLETPLKPGDGIVFDEGHPDQDEQGGRIYAVKSLPNGKLELQFRDGDINPAAISPGALVWKTDDPALKRRLEHSYARDEIVRRTPLTMHLSACVGAHLTLTATADAHTATATYAEKPLEPANKHPLTEAAAREQLSRLGDTPFELQTLTLDTDNQTMVPKSILNDLRRQVTQQLLATRPTSHPLASANALETLRKEITTVQSPLSDFSLQTSDFHLHILARSLPQIEALLSAKIPLASLTADFEDVRLYPQAIALCRTANIKIALATLRIVKPNEHGFLKQISDANPDALLIRHLGALHYYRTHAPHLPLVGDYSLNIANELTAALFAEQGLTRMVPSYDLNWTQLASLLRRFDPAKFEVVIHQHMPMFHMEHCVFAHTLSNGADYRTCGRPCEKHKVELSDRVGEPHPLLADVACRNTVFNAQAQSAAEYLPQMKSLGLSHFRLELLRESPEESLRIVTHYLAALAGESTPAKTLHSLRVLNQLGVTKGTLARD